MMKKYLVCLYIFTIPAMTGALSAVSNRVQNVPNLESKMQTIPNKSEIQPSIRFSHVQMFVDQLEDLEVYKRIEEQLNTFAAATTTHTNMDLSQKKQLWTTITRSESSLFSSLSANFETQNRDIVKQLLVGLGFRVTGARYTSDSRSVLVTSPDPRGVQFLVTAIAMDGGDPETRERSENTIFDPAKIQQFLNANSRRQGIGVLAFAVDDVLTIKKRYEALHPALVANYQIIHDNKVLEVFAYYENDSAGQERRKPDVGTILRFVEFASEGESSCCALGMESVDAAFDGTSQSAYCDHWVSNVFDRTEFLDTLHDTLGFTPKVDFNAGVVAAGEAQIESTVTGNDVDSSLDNPSMALRDQRQVFLPINNALSSVGHVHGFLNEMGQGVQHIASRVEDLVSFVQRGNEYREIAGEGFSFLRIPRSYYGVLSTRQLIDQPCLFSEECANAIMACLEASGLLSKDKALCLQIKKEELHQLLEERLEGNHKEEYLSKLHDALEVIFRSRYRNLHSLLRDSVSEDTYLGIVRNQILIDVQGDDLLYQIFTANILQRNTGEEAPFLEFIQRVCSDTVVKPGCGGFGIRNFLTLFLSIEVSKAMQEVADAKETGDLERQTYAQRMVDYFTDQLNESNPILTEISDAMTEEGICKDKISECLALQNNGEAEQWRQRLQEASAKKMAGNAKLMECSSRYNDLMKQLRIAHDHAVTTNNAL